MAVRASPALEGHRELPKLRANEETRREDGVQVRLQGNEALTERVREPRGGQARLRRLVEP